MKSPFLCLALGAIALALPAAAVAAPAAGKTLDLSARSTVYDGRAKTITARGDVRVTMPPMQISCAEATLYTDARETAVVKIVFTGAVTAKKGDDVFRAERITYYVPERRMVAEGTVKTRLKLPLAGSGPIQGP